MIGSIGGCSRTVVQVCGCMHAEKVDGMLLLAHIEVGFRLECSRKLMLGVGLMRFYCLGE